VSEDYRLKKALNTVGASPERSEIISG
jgi:hypothetical protein